jgi:hypothetical protein
MLDWIFSSPRHEAIFSLVSAAWWACTTAFVWFRRAFPFGWGLTVRRSERPRLYWGMLAASVVITAQLAISGATRLMR